MRKLITLVVVLVSIMVFANSTISADDGLPNTQPLGLTGVDPGWYAGMTVVIGQTQIYTGPYSQEKLGTVQGVVKGQIANLSPRMVRNWSTHRPIHYSRSLEMNNRVAVLPLGETVSCWRGLGWVPKERVIPFAAYEGQFDGEKKPRPSLLLCSP